MKELFKNILKRALDGLLSLLMIAVILTGINLVYASITDDDYLMNLDKEIIEINNPEEDLLTINNPQELTESQKKIAEFENKQIKFKEDIQDSKKLELINKFEKIQKIQDKKRQEIIKKHDRKQEIINDRLHTQSVETQIASNYERLKSINLEIENDFEQLVTQNFTAEERDLIEIEPAYVYETQGSSYTPNDPLFDYQWGPKFIANNKIPNDNNDKVLVAVIDTNIDYMHEDLQENFWNPSSCVNENGYTISGGCPNHGWDFWDNDNDPRNYENSEPTSDPNSEAYHGTGVSGIIGANTNNNVGLTSFANNKAIIMAIKIANDKGETTTTLLASAIRFAVNNGAKIINMSLGGDRITPDVISAIGYAKSNNVLIIAAAGNYSRDNDTDPFYPASYSSDNIISVASLDKSGELSYFSHYGVNSVDIAAPGHNILLAAYETYKNASGTSFSAPLVTAAAVQMYKNGDSYVTLRNKILSSTEKLTGASAGKIAGDRYLVIDNSTATTSNLLSNITTDYLTFSHYNNLLGKINSIIATLNIISTDNSIKLTRGNCYWKTIYTNEGLLCNSQSDYAVGICLTNKANGCPNGVAYGNAGDDITAGAIQCCSSYE